MMTYYPALPVQLDEGAYMPERAHATDAGADLRTPVDVVVEPYSSVTIDTGVHVELGEHSAAVIVPKSGLNVHENVVSFGLIDQGYSGGFVVKLYNLGPDFVRLPRGSKVAQFVVVPVCYPTFRLVARIRAGERGDAGFGSTETITRGPRI